MSENPYHPLMPYAEDTTEYRHITSDFVEHIKAGGREIIKIDPEGIAQLTSKGFSETYLPETLVLPFAYTLPFVEFILGVLLVLGWKTKFAAIASGLLIATLLFGMAMQEDWDGVGNLMVYAIFFFLLII